jgi:hypothetical protein
MVMMKFRLLAACLFCMLIPVMAGATRLFIPMSATEQKNHLKAYGIVYAALQKHIQVDWLLNFRGGSYAMPYDDDIAALCSDRGVTCSKIAEAAYSDLVKSATGRKKNGYVVKLEKAPRIAVYTPAAKKPWDDAVTLALTYAGIPFDKIYVNEVLGGALDKYDWLHLHHEDFTGQYGKFWAQFHNAEWYRNEQAEAESLARRNGFRKVSQMQLAVVKKIRSFVGAGGNLFAMCSATDTYDIALAANGTDICAEQFDGDPMDSNAQSKLNFDQCFAFRNFTLVRDPAIYEYSNIDNTIFRNLPREMDSFTIHSFPVKPDPVPAMLTQNHATTIHGFMGQTTAFRNEVLKPGVLVLAGYKAANEARFIHGDYGKGAWTFYGGHDPEAYQHMVNDPQTDLNQFPNSPGYRLILNNVLQPGAQRDIVPTVYYPDGKVPKESTSLAKAEDNSKPMTERVQFVPDPSSMNLVVKMAGIIQEIVITDAAGKEVFRKTCSAPQIVLDLNNFSTGLYLVEVNGHYAGKIVKN